MAYFPIACSKQTLVFWAALIILHSSNLSTSTNEAAQYPRVVNILDNKLRRFFNILDYDNNDKVDKKEFLSALGGQSEGTSVKPEELRAAVKLSEKRVELIFRVFDANEDHLLDKSEITSIFQTIDINNDRAVTFAEFKESIMEFTYDGETADSYLQHEEF